MGVNLSIKNAPEDVVQRLKERAAKNHRSLNGEVLSILEEATLMQRTLSVDEAIEKIRALRLPKGGPKGVDLIRADRDSR
jgi:plasmid stability protein